MDFAEKMKNLLNSCIDDLQKDRDLCFYNPKTDFTRNRKLPFASILKCFFVMEGSSIQKELLKFTDYDPQTASDSAFCQQRKKIRPEAFLSLFHSFTRLLPYKTYKGYRLLACDGSNLCTSIVSDDTKYKPQGGGETSKCRYLHLNALYDLQTCIYTAIDVEPAKIKNEKASLVRMLYSQPADQKAIYIADRGYESYNVIAHIDSKGQKFVIRVKDNRIGGFTKFFEQPDSDEFDEEYTRKFTRSSSRKYIQRNDTYIPIRHKYQQMDFFTPEHEDYEIRFRIIRFALNNGYECLVTNLSKEEFPTDEIKKLYRLRWGIETSFCQLKYTVGLNYFHGKKEALVLQEIYARIIMFNFSQSIAKKVELEKVRKNVGTKRKWEYKTNFKRIVSICRRLIMNRIKQKEIAQLLAKNMISKRPERSYKRKFVLKVPTFRLYSM